METTPADSDLQLDNDAEPTQNVIHEILSDLKAIGEEAATLFSTGTLDDAAVAIFKAQFEVTQAHFIELGAQAKDQAEKYARAADKRVKDNLYTSLAIALCGGLLLGVCLGRSSASRSR